MNSRKLSRPGFERLRIWQKAYQLMIKAHEICKSLPANERYNLPSQAERSSSSVVDNIAEACSTYYYNDKIRTSYVARREAGETQNHLRKMEGKRYITSEKANFLILEYEALIRGINGFINSIKRKREADKAYKGR